jgi:hypothetical protein
MHLDDYNCVLCTEALEESLVHLILECSFTRSCWFNLGLLIHNSSDPFSTLASFRAQLQQPFFMEIIVTMSWSIRMVRNDAIFKHVQPSVHHCKRIFLQEFALVILRAKNSLAPSFTQWLEAYV